VLLTFSHVVYLSYKYSTLNQKSGVSIMNNIRTAPSLAQQSGFTLIEIAIVLVIVGLLLGGVLQGQQLIENSRVRAAVNDINGTAAAMYSYRDRYGRWPGDDGPLATLQARGGPWASFAAASAGNADGFIATGDLRYPFNPIGEGVAFWQHLRASRFMSGDAALTGIAALPNNPFGGLIGIATPDMYQTAGAGTGLEGIKVCMSQVPGSAAAALDRQLDDGRPNSGRVRAHAVGAGNVAPVLTTPSTAYVETSPHTICIQI
jgi:prepilin-type N-terminal cleavage/methylation domain-containing protein